MADPVYDLEFNGPFPDWWNVVDDFGADPTGVADSQDAFQAMFNAMCKYGGTVKNGTYVGYTGYIPNGTYKIGGTLQLPSPYTGQPVSGEGVNLWGQDPENVILKWAGDPGGTILHSDGCHSSTVGRITFDGQGTAGAGFEIRRHPDIPLQNTYSRLQDCIVKDATTGFLQGNSEYVGLDSEFSIMRCRFYRCSEFGVRIMKGEAYNYWIRQSYFEDCDIAIGNGPSGAFNAYDNVFVRSTTYDIYAEWMRICGIRRNRSFDSKRFIYVKGANIVIEGNEVSNTTETDAVVLDNRFKVMVLNNKFKSAAEATTGPVINEIFNPFSPFGTPLAPFAPLFIFFNQFTVPNPINLLPNTTMGNEMEGNITNPSLTVEMPPIPPFPLQVIRQTFYVDALDDPQQTVDDATAHAVSNPGSEPVVYLPSYSNQDRLQLSRTLVFPPNVKMSLQGGGIRSAFYWVWATRDTYRDPYLLFRGPSKITIQNVQLGITRQEGGKVGLIAVFDNCDQVGSRVYADNCSGIYQFRALAHQQADVCDHIVGSYAHENLPMLVSAPSEGMGDGRVLHEGGASSDTEGNEPMLSVRTGGRYYLREFWYETTNTDKVWARIEGMGAQPGNFTIETSLIEQHTSEQKWRMKVIEASNWWGNILYVDSLIIGTTAFTGESSRGNYLSFGGGSPLRSDSMTPATMYRHDGIPYYIAGFWTMHLTQETMEDNSGWGIYGTKPTNWQERLWDTTDRTPTTWIDILGDGITDVRLHRVKGDIAFMSDEYTLVEEADLVQTTDFMSGILPSDAIYAHASFGTMYNSSALQVYGPENLCEWSQDLSVWTLSANGTGTAPIATANDAEAPDGTVTATKLEFDCGSGTTMDDWSLAISNDMDVFSSIPTGYAFWLKGTVGTKLVYQGIAFDDIYWADVTCTGEWQLVRRWGGGGSGTPGPLAIGIRQGTAPGNINSTATVWIWGTQLERYNGVRPYLATDAEPKFGPRFDHDPLTGALLGCLNEPESTNGVAVSVYDYGVWTSVNAALSHDGTLGPEGHIQAIKITANAGLADHYGGPNATGAGTGVDIGHSAFVKRGNTRYVVLLDDSDASWHGATFDFDSGAWVGTGTNVTLLTPVRMANGWWRLGWVCTMTNNVGAIRVAPTPNGAGTPADVNYDAVGTEYAYATGAQFDSPGVGVTSFIPTRNAVLSRAGEALYVMRPDGVYDIEIVRQNGTELLAGQTVTNGSFTVPTNTSPVVKVVTKRSLPQGNTWTFDFLSGALPPTASLTRADATTCASYYNSAGILQLAAPNVARFTHDPVTLALEGNLVEMQSTNACPYSQNLSGTGWDITEITAVNNAQVAPDGTVTAASLTESSATAARSVQFSDMSFVTDSYYGVSVFVRNLSGSRWVQVGISGGHFVNFQPSSGSIGNISDPRISNVVARQLANGWWRLSLLFQSPFTAGSSFRLYMVASGTAPGGQSYAGDGTSAVAMWGVQVDSVGVGVTSYVPTAGSTVTRATDVLTLPVPNGTYTATIERLSGNTTLTEQVVTTGAYTVPTSTSPLRRVILIKVA